MADASKFEWKKSEKQWYMPKQQPELKAIPAFHFFVLEGEGSPDDASFAERVEALYGASYGVRMSYKSGQAPEGFYEYTVYPLEGVWSLTEEGIRRYQAMEQPDITALKPYMKYQIMIRQPDFVTEAFSKTFLEALADKKQLPLIKSIQWQRFEEGPVVQMCHVGPYATEPESFAQMEAYAASQGFKRRSKEHREIYISDPRKTADDKLKTVLRFLVTKDK